MRERSKRGTLRSRLRALLSQSLDTHHISWTAFTVSTMGNSDSEDDVYDDIEFENASEGDEDLDEDIIDALEGDLAAAVAAEGTEGEEVCS